jgi:flagellar biosynthesis protein FliP
MKQSPSRWVVYGLVGALMLCVSQDASARYGSSQFRRYMQQQSKAQQQVLQAQQKVMMEVMARQAAIEKQRRENVAKASKARHDKEEQHRQDLIAKRRAEQAGKSDTAAGKADPKKN